MTAKKHGRKGSEAVAAPLKKVRKNMKNIQEAAPDRPLLTIEEVAALLEVHPDTVSTMHTSGRMPAPIKIGYRTVRFRRSDIDFWIAEGCKSAKVTKSKQAIRRK